MPATVLLVDDERNIQVILSRALSMEGYAVEVAGGGREALEKIAALPVDVVVMDVRMPDLDGLSVMEKAREARPELSFVVMSGHGSLETVRSAFKLGAFDYLEKPITEKEKLLVAVRNALAIRTLREENARLRREAGPLEMVGGGAAMKRLFDVIRRTAPSAGRVPVTAELIESELFGHERGAFTGAIAARRGKFEQADGGTLFLDEVGDMPPAMQAKVLRVLQEGEFERVGGQQTLRCDVRVIAATNKDLAAEVKAGRFREDLFYRLAVVPIHAPPLRERREDVPELATRFLAEACERNGRRPMKVSREALLALQAHEWPGNVRELRNLVERLAILSDGPEIGVAEVAAVLPDARRPRADRFRGGASFHDLVEEAEREIILGALDAHADNVSDTARALGLERSHLYKKMRALGIRRGTTES